MKVAALWLFLVLACLGVAQTFPSKPHKAWVADEAHLIAPADKERIRHDSAALMHMLKAPIVVATIPSLKAEHAAKLTIEQYGRKLFDYWGIGSQNHNLGILLLVSKGDRKVRIEMGADWRNRYDDQANDVMQSVIMPEFKGGHFSQGIRKGADALLQMAQKEASSQATPATSDASRVSAQESGSSSFNLGILFFLFPCIFVVVLLLASLVIRSARGGGNGVRGQKTNSYNPTQDPNNPIFHPKPTTYDSGTSASSNLASGGFGGGGSSGGGGFDGGSGGGGGSTGSY